MTTPIRQLDSETALQWLFDHPGSTQGECLDALLPGLSDAERATWENRLRKWVWRDRKAGGARVAAPARGPAPAAPVPGWARGRAPPVPTSNTEEPAEDEPRLAWLRRELRKAERLSDKAIEDDQLRVWPLINKRLCELRDEYDEAMELERQVVKLEPGAGAICAELDRRGDAIALRAELQRRKVERVKLNSEEG